MNTTPKSAPKPFPAAGAAGQRSAHENPGRRDDRDDEGRDDHGREDEADRGGSGQRRPGRDEPKKDLPGRGSEPRRGAMKAASLALCGAVAGALLAFAPATPVQAAQHDNADEADSAQPVTDSWITGKVKAVLATTEGVQSLDISVTTVNGVVTLTGVQSTDLAVKKAVAAAKSVKGVKEVDAAGLKAKS